MRQILALAAPALFFVFVVSAPQAGGVRRGVWTTTKAACDRNGIRVSYAFEYRTRPRPGYRVPRALVRGIAPTCAPGVLTIELQGRRGHSLPGATGSVRLARGGSAAVRLRVPPLAAGVFRVSAAIRVLDKQQATVTIMRPGSAPSVCEVRVPTRGLVGDFRSGPLLGSARNDIILGHGGSDRILGLAGADCVLGGPGADVLIGGAGDDVLSGGPGYDRCYGGRGRDRFVGCEVIRR